MLKKSIDINSIRFLVNHMIYAICLQFGIYNLTFSNCWVVVYCLEDEIQNGNTNKSDEKHDYGSIDERQSQPKARKLSSWLHNVNIKFVFIKYISTSYLTLHVNKDYTLALKTNYIYLICSSTTCFCINIHNTHSKVKRMASRLI